MTMNCNSVRDQLSAYMDGEAVASSWQYRLSNTCQAASRCAKELAAVQATQRSRSCSSRIDRPTASLGSDRGQTRRERRTSNGTTLAAESSTLDPRAQGLTPIRSLNWKKITGAIVALAATVLIVANI